MGPRSRERGNLRAYREHRAYSRFNGAALSERGNALTRTADRSSRLQWGRALSSAEMPPGQESLRRSAMLQWGRALVSAEIAALVVTVSGIRRASMGPRSRERGNLHAARQSSASAYMLQWGRALVSAEIRACRSRSVCRDRASMGPRSRERGNSVDGIAITPSLRLASMGPRSRERGNALHGQDLADLDCSASMGPRSRERGNSGHSTALRIAKLRLQWGRALVSAEITVCCITIERSSAASMGPRSRERGNRLHVGTSDHLDGASMGPRSRERGNDFPEAGKMSGFLCFNGAALS